MLYDRDKRFLEELSILVSRKIDYLLCFEKTFMSSIRSFTIGFLFSDTHYYSKHPKTIVRRSKEPYSLSSKFKHLHSIEEECPACSINDYLTDFIMQREIEKGKTKYCEQSYYNTITYFSNSNEEARDIFAQYLEEFKEYIKTADLFEHGVLSGIHEGSIDNILDSYDTMVKVAQENNYDIIGSPTEVLVKNIHNADSEEEYITEIRLPIIKM